MSWNISLCDGCVHRISDERCKAYPTGIPDKFIFGDAYHTKPEAGDHGLQFVAKDDVWKETAAQVLAEAANPEPTNDGDTMP